MPDSDSVPPTLSAYDGFLEGLEIEGFRSFSERVQIAPLGKLNVFIGPNNAGKSNVLLFIARYLPNLIQSMTKQTDLSFTDLDKPDGEKSDGIRLGVSAHLASLPRTIHEKTGCPERSFEKLFESPPLSDGSARCWFRYFSADYAEHLKFSEKQATDIAEYFPQPFWNDLSHQIKGHPGRGGSVKEQASAILRHFSPLSESFKETSLVSAFRRVTASPEEEASEGDNSGEGLIEVLHDFQHPDIHQQQKRELFDKINHFVKEVTENDKAELEVPAKANDLYVTLDGKTKLPLENFGTGIHEVIILAASATIRENEIICIEEPELHLHPHLQRQLIRYLIDKTSNQYFISTHSAHIMDCSGGNIFEVSLRGGCSQVRHVFDEGDRFTVCQNLGFRASDLIQANCIIWVEGPSDRIYLRHWLNVIAPDLREGIHYSIMFYGGRLLSNLSVDDESLEHLIPLLPINRNVIVVMDRDRFKASDPVNETKTRISTEVKGNGGVAWITEGREIENYVSKEFLRKAVSVVSPEKLPEVEANLGMKWTNCLAYNSGNSRKKSLDKVKVALEVEKQGADLDRYDLRKRLEEVRDAIRRFNHMK